MTKPKLLVKSVNTWGNVEYNIPLRHSYNETRSSTSIGLRPIPAIYKTFDCKTKDPFPLRVTGRDRVVEQETYRTTSGEYCVKASYNKANERADSAILCKNVHFMTDVEKKLDGVNIQKPVRQSEAREKFRWSQIPEPIEVIQNPGEANTFPFVATGRPSVPCIPETAKGFRRLLDPYLTTYRDKHRPFTIDEQYGIAAKDHITFYTESPFIGRAKGFGPKFKEIWMPLQSKPNLDPPGNAKRNPDAWLKGSFKTEMHNKFRIPFVVSRIITAKPDEFNPFPPVAPNPWQTNCAPNMYCSEYCNIAQRLPTNQGLDQMKRQLKPRGKCLRINVSKRPQLL